MKLYAIADSSLNKRQQFVQATHAVAQYLIDNPDSEWKNGSLVMLKTNDMNKTIEWLDVHGVKSSKFIEPYYDDKLTAVCAYDIGWLNHVKELRLI